MNANRRYPYRTAEEHGVGSLYEQVLACWNLRDAQGFSELFAEESQFIGLDGSVLEGPWEIGVVLGAVFAHRQTAAYVAKVRGVRMLTPTVALLHAVAGMVPPGEHDINPATNTVHALVASSEGGRWRIILLQNTHATFLGRPELGEDLTRELREELGSVTAGAA